MRQHLRRKMAGAVAGLAGAAALLLATSAPASADPPVDSHNGGVVTMQCDALGPLDTVATSHGEWVHAAQTIHVIGSNLTLLAYAYRFEFTPAVGDPFVVEGAKAAPSGASCASRGRIRRVCSSARTGCPIRADRTGGAAAIGSGVATSLVRSARWERGSTAATSPTSRSRTSA